MRFLLQRENDRFFTWLSVIVVIATVHIVFIVPNATFGLGNGSIPMANVGGVVDSSDTDDAADSKAPDATATQPKG